MALGLSLGLAQPALARADLDAPSVRAGLNSLASLLAEQPPQRHEPLANLVARHGLRGLVPGPGPVSPFDSDGPTTPASTELVDFRPILALLAQGTTAEDNAAVLAARNGSAPQALAFRNGLVTADLLNNALAGLRPDLHSQRGTVRMPIILWQDTVLRLGPQDWLDLSTTDGAFVVSLGRVEIDGATIRAVGSPNPRSPGFAPFLTVAGGGQLQMRDAVIRDLGFGFSDKFAGVSVLRHPFMAATGPSHVTGTQFDNIVSLVLSGMPDTRVADNRFHNMRGNAVRVSLSPGAKIVGNLFSGVASTNAIRVIDNSNGTLVAGNLVLAGARVGIVVDGGSAYVTVRDNVLWRRNGGGIKFSDTRCGLVAGNLVLDSRQKGIEVYASPGTRILRNRIEGNRSAALWISGQPRSSVTLISGNVLRGNGTGLATATAARLWLEQNDFSEQLPRLVGGDISLRNTALVRDLRGLVPIQMTASAAVSGGEQPNGGCGGLEDK